MNVSSVNRNSLQPPDIDILIVEGGNMSTSRGRQYNSCLVKIISLIGNSLHFLWLPRCSFHAHAPWASLRNLVSLLAEYCTETGKKWTCFAKQDPGRARQKSHATKGPLFSQSLYTKSNMAIWRHLVESLIKDRSVA